MNYLTNQLLINEEIETINNNLKNQKGLWEDGKKTAGSHASKVKNKIIESLNEKFEFITSSSKPFIKISKSSQDKRIQILSLNYK